jgi:hypothetical protein
MEGFPSDFRRLEVAVTSLDEVRRVVVETVRAADEGVLGTTLAAAVRDEISEFQPIQFGARNLKDFVAKHVPEVGIIRRSGADIVYGLASGAATLEAAAGESSVSVGGLWATWATPTSPRVLDVSDDGDVSVALPAMVANKRLDPLPANAHREIAQGFLNSEFDSLALEVKSQLETALSESEATWWISWMAVTRANPALNSRWLRFRTERMHDQLRQGLQALGLAEGAVSRASSAILESRRVSDVLRRAAVEASNAKNRLSIRDVAKRVIDLMDESEVRRLSLPVGLVHDVMKKNGR